MILMEIIDSHTHWGPSVTMGIEVTTEEILRQAEQSGVNRIVIFPFPSMALADEEVNRKLLEEADRVNPVRNSSGALNPTGIIAKSNPATEQRGIISNGVNGCPMTNVLAKGKNTKAEFPQEVQDVFMLSLLTCPLK